MQNKNRKYKAAGKREKINLEIVQRYNAFSRGVKPRLQNKPRTMRQMHGKNGTLCSMALRIVEFSNGGYKIRKIFA